MAKGNGKANPDNLPPEKQVENRDGGNGQFLPGKSGNLNGRPKKGLAWADVANEILESQEINLKLTAPDGTVKSLELKANTSFRHAIVIAQIKEALAGNVAAAKELADRTEGKAPQFNINANMNRNHGTFDPTTNDPEQWLKSYLSKIQTAES
jgi:hypothetical protein